MKRVWTLLLAALFLLALFAGCSGNTGGTTAAPGGTTQTGGESTGGTQSGGTQSGGETTPAVDEGPYKMAKGKYQVDSNGVPTELYVYELPMSTTEEVFTLWTTPILSDQMPEKGMGDLPYQQELHKRTGVNIEYIEISGCYPGGGPRHENFAVLLAADDLPDIVTNVDWYYQGPFQGAWDDGYFVNLYDYLDYIPCYWYRANEHPEDVSLLATILSQPNFINCFWCLEAKPVMLRNGVTRGDYLDKLGLKNDDLITLDDWHMMLTRYKNELDIPHSFLLYNTLDAQQLFNCFDTTCGIDLSKIASPLLDNGKVVFACTRQQDLNFLTYINQWWNEGLIYQDWASALSNVSAADQIANGEVTLFGIVPSESVSYEASAADPDCYFVPLHKPILKEGQVFHCGDDSSWISYGSWSVSSKCENIPLVCTYLDYFYSEEGVFLSNYGVEGVSWERGPDGSVQLTDMMINNTSGLSMALLHYAMNELVDGGVNDRFRSYAYPGGERIANFHYYWSDPQYYRYDGTIDWPDAITLTSEQTEECMEHGSDMNTYISENVLLFVDGSRPLSEWDNYVAGLEALGVNEVQKVYQEAYDDFIAIYG